MGVKGEASLTFYPAPDPRDGGGRLEISLPELRLGLDRLQKIPPGSEPFRPLLDHVLGTLGKARWLFGEQTYQGEEVHYAFSRSIVEPLLPELLDPAQVPFLRKKDNEADLPLFWDFSKAGGPGGELETTDLDIARDILARLTDKYLDLTGRR